MDYQTGELIAYVGSADYYSTKHSKRFQPKYDVVGDGYRQPGSAFKPFNYAIGIDDRQAHRGHRADGRRHRLRQQLHAQRRRQPRARSAHRPQRTAVLAQHPVGQGHGGQRPEPRLRSSPGVRAALPVATRARPVCHWRSATQETPAGRPGHRLRHDRQRRSSTSGTPRSSRSRTALARTSSTHTSRPSRTKVISPQAAYIVDQHPGRQHESATSTRSGASSRIKGPGGDRRPATLKTGTNNDAKDLNAYGFIAPPTARARKDGEYALAVGAWNGNSDNSEVSTPNKPVFSIDVSTYVWQGFLQEATKDWPIRNFRRPEGAWSRSRSTRTPATCPSAATRASTNGSSWAPSRRTGFRANRAAARCSTSWPTSRSSRTGWSGTATGCGGHGAARARAGGPDRTRVTYFYNNAFNPFGRTGARSWARTAPSRRPSPPAFRCRARTPAG